MGKKKDKKKKKQEASSNEVKIWKIQHGPFHVTEVDDPHVPDDLEYMVVALIEVDGELDDMEFWFRNREDVAVWEKHFASKIDPIILRF